MIEPDLSAAGPSAAAAAGESPLMDAHSMEPTAVLGLLRVLGGNVRRVVVVGCEPATVEEGMGLSEPVARAVDEAVRVVRGLVAEIGAETAAGASGGRP